MNNNTFQANDNNNQGEQTPLSITDHPVLSDVTAISAEIDAIQAEIKAAEERVRLAKQRLGEAVMELPAKIGDNEDLRDEIIYQLYWFDELNVSKVTLKKAFHVASPGQSGKSSKIVIRPRLVEKPCRECDRLFQVEKQSYSGFDYSYLCNDCKTKREQSRGQQQRLEQERIQVLRTMPYRAYLQTPEWQERRYYAMKRAGFRCQVCNVYGVRLNVHHRTYERRGDEWNSDLITLCEGCHAIFHENGKLAEGRA